MLLYCECEMNFLKVTKFVYHFKWKRKFERVRGAGFDHRAPKYMDLVLCARLYTID